MQLRLGFIGAGAMGEGMAARLLEAGYPVSVIAHRNRAPIDRLVARGASEAARYPDLVAASDVILLCVSSSAVVEQVVAVLKPHLRAGMMVADFGTSSPDSVRTVCGGLAEIDVGFVETPVTGGVVQAASGKLGALVGAKPAMFEAVRPILDVLCQTVSYFGPPGAGNTAKLINNYMVLGIAALVTECFDLADRADVDWQKLYDVAICGSGDSGVLRRIIGNAVNGDFRGYVFDVNGAHKDISYFCALAEDQGGVSPLARSVRALYEKAVACGYGERYLSELSAPDVRHRLAADQIDDL